MGVVPAAQDLSPEVIRSGAHATCRSSPMAINHGDSSVLGFFDGHSEIREWRDRLTIERVDKLLRMGVTRYGIDYPTPDQISDIQYMADGWAYRHK